MRETVDAHLAQPFVWGASDCATLFADAINVAFGVDPLAGLRGYYDEASARLALAKWDYMSVRELVQGRAVAIDPEFSQPGDVGFPRLAWANRPLMSPLIVLGPYAFTKATSGPVVRCRSILHEVYRWRS
jgi:hypothetical protein